MKVLALDIGGANLKAAHSDGEARSRAFAVWRHPHDLGPAITDLIHQLPRFDHLAVTMTAELCDCFPTKIEGVHAVLRAVERSASRLEQPPPIHVWLTTGQLVPLADALAEPLRAAASNWLALATWAGRLCPADPALLIDVGSTTTDIVPLEDGIPVPRGHTDLERLIHGELVYSGVRRTPVAALVRTVEVANHPCRVASELFATTRDTYLWLGDLPEQPDDRDTADGRPATRAAAGQRIARMLCADRWLGPPNQAPAASFLTDDQIESVSRQVAAAQLRQLSSAMQQVLANQIGQLQAFIVAGSGEFLARRLVQAHGDGDASSESGRIISLSDEFGSAISSAACAHALATLASERLSPMAQGSAPGPDESGRAAPQSDDAPHSASARSVVVKVGGSLLDLAGLGDRLRRWLDRLGTPRVVIVVGGGPAADQVRLRDQLDDLGEEKAHWLATRALTFNSHLMEGLLDRSRVVNSESQCRASWDSRITPILDPHTFLLADTAGSSPLPRNWQVTSDSIAARVARALDADELVLLKSVTWAGEISEAARQGIVDDHLPRELSRSPRLVVRIVNFRTESAEKP